MRCNSLECFPFFLFLIVGRAGALPISGRDNLFHGNGLPRNSSSSSNESPLPVIPTIDYTTRSCLYVSPHLQPCNFNRNDNYQRFHRSLDESNEGVKFKRKFPFEELVTVYAIQGCLPSRLPFRMALCESKENVERATRIWKLYPFQGTEEERRNSFVFPRFDLERWTREMKLREKEERERKNGEKTIAKGAGDSDEDSVVQSREYFPATISSNLEEEEKSAVSSVVRNHSRESRMDDETRRRRRRNERPEGGGSSREDRREIGEVKELPPYSKSISSDPTRFGRNDRSSNFLRAYLPLLLLSRRSRDVRLGSEFPYWKAIPYDSKKHKFYGIVADDRRLQKLHS